MALREDLKPGVLVNGLLPGTVVNIVSVICHGEVSAELIYKDAAGNLGSVLLYEDDIAKLTLVTGGLPWSFDADGALFRLTLTGICQLLPIALGPMLSRKS